jgi:hypothetical protein
LIAVAAAAAFTLTGCVKIHTESAFSDSNTVDQTIIIAVDPDVLSQVGANPDDLTADAFLDRVPYEQADRITIEDYVDGELEGVRIVATDLTFDELASAGDALGESADESGEGDFAGAGLLGGITATEVVRQGDHYVVTIPAAESGEVSIPGVDASAIGGFINFEAVFSFPGPVVSSSHGDVNGKTVTLEFEDIQSGEDITIRAVAKEAIAWGPIITWGIIALAVLVIIAGAIALGILELRKRRPDLPEPELTDGTGAGVLPDAPPPPPPAKD